MATHRRILTWLQSADGPPTARLARSHIYIASIALAEGDLATAHEHAQAADQIVRDTLGRTHPLDPIAAMLLGHVQLERDEASQARASLERALSKLEAAAQPSNYAQVEIGIAELDLRAGDRQSATTRLDAADSACASLDEQSDCRAQIDFARARLAWDVGDAEEALRLARAAQGAVGRIREGSPMLTKRIDAWIEARPR
jgi:ATP/maltotriose-dependent transcriptional regulator MalT